MSVSTTASLRKIAITLITSEHNAPYPQITGWSVSGEPRDLVMVVSQQLISEAKDATRRARGISAMFDWKELNPYTPRVGKTALDALWLTAT